jgi:predicted ATPase
MLALYRSGRQADALALYGRLRRLLDDELGLAPGHDVRRLQEAILRHDPALDVTAPAPGPAPATRATSAVNLPVHLTRFVGRGRELERVARTLAEHRLLTLIGTGGVGKTRLAVAVAQRVPFPPVNEVAFVPLAGVTEPALVLPAVARVLDVPEQPEATPLAGLRRHVGDRRLLLVLDNFEQVTAAAAAVVELLGACPCLRVLATSRVPLRVAGERRVEVPPLALPAAGAGPEAVAASEAAALYLDRAQAVRADVGLDGDAADAVAQLCVRLDGLPLALELAAAHAVVLPPRALLDRLARRLDLPAGSLGDVPPRQRTLRATLDWSHDLLGPGARRLFAHLAVFVGGATLEAVEAVCADRADGTGVLEALTALVDSGLVHSQPANGGQRFRMLETVREYALERLNDLGPATAAAAHGRHAAHLLAMAEAGKPPPGFADDRRLTQIDGEADDVHAALRWAIEAGEAELAGRLAAALYRWWLSTGRLGDGRHWTGRLLGRPDELPPLLLAEVLLADGFLAANQGDYTHAANRYEQSRVLWAAQNQPAGQARCLYGLATVCNGRNEFAAATALYEQSLPLARRGGDELMVVRILSNLGAGAEGQGDHARARALYEEALSAAHRVGSPGEACAITVQLALMVQVGGDPERAAVLAAGGVEAARATGSPNRLSFALLIAGVVALRSGDQALARARYTEALAIAQEGGLTAYVADCLSGLAGAARLGGDTDRAVRLFAAAAGLLERAGLAPERGADRECYDAHLAALRAELPAAAFDDAWAAGRAMTEQTAIAAALHPPCPVPHR